MAKSPTSRLRRATALGATVASASALSLAFALPAGATLTQPATNYIVGSGSSTTYNMMSQMDVLFNESPSCNPINFTSGATTPLDNSCVSANSSADKDAIDPTFSNGVTQTPENPWGDVSLQQPPLGSSNGIAQLENVGSSGGAQTFQDTTSGTSVTVTHAPKSNLFAVGDVVLNALYANGSTTVASVADQTHVTTAAAPVDAPQTSIPVTLSSTAPTSGATTPAFSSQSGTTVTAGKDTTKATLTDTGDTLKNEEANLVVGETVLDSPGTDTASGTNLVAKTTVAKVLGMNIGSATTVTSGSGSSAVTFMTLNDANANREILNVFAGETVTGTGLTAGDKVGVVCTVLNPGVCPQVGGFTVVGATTGTSPLASAGNDITATPVTLGTPGAFNLSQTDISDASISVDLGTVSKVDATQHSTSANVSNNVNFARSSRGYTSGDYTGLNFVAYAEDAVSWFHYTSIPSTNTVITQANGVTTTTTHPASSVAAPSSCITNLSKTQLANIYNGTYTNWNQIACTSGVGTGVNAPIVVFAPQEGSGTQSTMKTYLGFDETLSTNKVNGWTANSATTGTFGGPIPIFENELSSLNDGNVTGYNALALPSFNVPTTVTTNNTWTYQTNKATAKTKTVLSVTVAQGTSGIPGISNDQAIKVNGVNNTVASFTGNVLKTSHGVTTIKTPATITLGTPLAAAAASGVNVTWTVTSTDNTQTVPVNTQTELAQADAVFLYSYGIWKHQQGITTATISPSSCDVSCGGVQGTGYAANLGNLDGVTLNDANTLGGNFPGFRYLYNVYSNGSNPLIAAAATPATLNYVSEAGFICKPQNASLADTINGGTYLSGIQHTIENAGFFPISAGYTSGTVNQTPTDEGSVPNPVGNMNLVQTSTTNGAEDYSQFMNVAAGSAAPATNHSNAGVKFTGGYQSQNGDPTGYCLVFSTDQGAGQPS